MLVYLHKPLGKPAAAAEEIYSTQTDITLNQPIVSSDGSLSAFATDDSALVISGTNPFYLKIDVDSLFQVV